jgi:hypothetical protein
VAIAIIIIIIIILIKIITDENVTLTKRLIKIKYCTYIISECSLQVEEILVCSWNRLLLMHHLDVSLSGRIGF